MARFQITINPAPSIANKEATCRIHYSHPIDGVLREVQKAGKATPEEEMYMVCWYALHQYIEKGMDARERKKLKDLGITRPHIPKLIDINGKGLV